MPRVTAMQSDEARDEEELMYGHGPLTQHELDDKYPNRPHNHSKTLPFRVLFQDLFNPLNDNKKKPSGQVINRRKQGPDSKILKPHEIREKIVERFIARWRRDVGNDIYPALRLIIPEKDRDRGMYGLKELTLAKLLIKIMKIDKNSADGYNLMHWKDPGKTPTAMAGDFAGRCFEVISKRPMRSTPGSMSIAEVNDLLDRLSVAQKEENQLPIMNEFYTKMNAEELMWLIRMILRQMKIGATEKTIFSIWHRDADDLFNISSSLRRVCWELYDPQVSLEGDDRGIKLMQCFQPQLAAFQMKSWAKTIERLGVTEDDPVFWIEEKLDGERMQLHMMEDEDTPGGVQFGFWSRKAKDYTYLYGNGFQDENAALTRHISSAFKEGVRNIILDGEMITWDPKQKAIVPFGTLKTAAIEQQNNQYATGHRPVFRVFDCLYLNGLDLTPYTLRDRRKALNESIQDVEDRLEIHPYQEGRTSDEIEERLRQVIATAGEGLVVKNPRSLYRLNDRNDDWSKVKPEYMTEFGESLDCIVIGGYYGSGKRGGALSSFLCGVSPPKLAVSSQSSQEVNPQRMLSFFKVGGGFSASDYAEIRHLTEGKWKKWDPKKPRSDWIALGGGVARQYEKPDMWIKPEDSVVVSVKAASVAKSESFAADVTLRFPRFKKLRTDKDWTQALTYDEFVNLRKRAEAEKTEKMIKMEESKRSRTIKKRKRDIILQGQEDEINTPYAGPETQTFQGKSFLVMTEALKPIKKSKAEIEQLIKANGGKIVASEADPDTVIIADRNLVKVASMVKRDKRRIIRPNWLLESIKQNELDRDRPSTLLPLEDRHLFHIPAGDEERYGDRVDLYGDSYYRDIGPDDLLELLEGMPTKLEDGYRVDYDNVHDLDFDSMPGAMFHGCIAHFEQPVDHHVRLFEFGNGKMATSLTDTALTHVVVLKGSSTVPDIRKTVAKNPRLPRVVTMEWITESWEAQTRLDEERFAPI